MVDLHSARTYENEKENSLHLNTSSQNEMVLDNDQELLSGVRVDDPVRLYLKQIGLETFHELAVYFADLCCSWQRGSNENGACPPHQPPPRKWLGWSIWAIKFIDPD